MSKWSQPERKNSRAKSFFSQLKDGDNVFMIRQSNHDVRNENIDSVTHGGTSSDNTSNLTQVNYP